MKLIIKSAIVYSTVALGNSQPNVVFILADDLGWKDTGVTGSDFYETPAIDNLAKDGYRFKNAYAPHPVCGPSRAAILTGKYPLRINNTGVKGNVSPKETTIGEAIKAAGYSTFFTGKWHCGLGPKRPKNQGFDVEIGVNSQGQPGSYHYPYKDTGMDWPGLKRKVLKARDVPGLSDGKPGEYLTDRLTDETIKFIESAGDKPFFAYLSHYAVHAPLESKEEYEKYFTKKRSKLPELSAGQAYITKDKNRFKLRQDNPVFAGMIKSFDDSVGRVIACLKKKGIYENTIIVVSSDNGGIAALTKDNIEFPTSNLPLKAGKGWNYEGGIRVPMIVSYPNKIAAGKVSETPVTGIDLYPTLLDLAGIPARPTQHKDGVSFAPVLRGESIARDTLYWFFPQAHGSGHKPSAAIRKGNMKLIHFFKDDRVELYDLSKDEAEQNNLASAKPELAAGLKKQLMDWRKAMKKK